MSIAVSGLTKRYESRRGSAGIPALRGVDLDVPDGELVAVLGPSGSGKSTLLRCVAGLETPDSGRIFVGGREVTNSAPAERDIAMVFQELALFPHLTVRDNVAFGLRARKTASSEIDRAVHETAELTDLDALLDRRPGELSGGERQRVALARAVIRQPKAFLLDEPLSNLDAAARARTRAEIRTLQRKLGTTMLYVTHDQAEALTLGDRVVVLRDGLVEQVGTPSEIYDEPATPFVAGFVGFPPMNVFPGGWIGVSDDAVGVRPEEVEIKGEGLGRFDADVELVERVGPERIVHLRVHGDPFLARISRTEVPEVDATVGAWFADDAIYRFPGNGSS